MNRTKCSTSIFFILLLAFIVKPISAQESPKAKGDQEAQKATEKKALALLDDIASAGMTMTIAENRIFIQLSVAELLWPRDTKRARALFQDATNSFISLINSDFTGNNQHSILSALRSHLRQQMLKLVTSHDVELALDFLRATRQPRLPAETRRNRYDEEIELEQGLAAQIAANDPKRALQIAEQSLKSGISYNLIALLSKLREKDDELAAKFANSLIAKLRSENLISNDQAGGFARDLLQKSIRSTTPTPPDSQPAASGKKRVTLLDTQHIRELMDMILTASLRASAANSHNNSDEYQKAKSFVTQLRFLRLEVEKYAPSRSSALQAKIAEFDKTTDESNRQWSEFYDLLQDNIDGALDLINKVPPDRRDSFYYGAAAKVMEAGDPERSRQIMSRISDAEFRNQGLVQIDRHMIREAASKGKFVETHRLLSGIIQSEDRAIAMAQTATALAEKGDKKAALEMFASARGLIAGQIESITHIGTHLEVAHAGISVSPDASSEIMENLIDQLNDIIAAILIVDRLRDNRFVKDGELILPQSFMLINDLYSRCVNELSQLARADFDRARAAADRFQRPETRLMARLRVAQGILANQQK